MKELDHQEPFADVVGLSSVAFETPDGFRLLPYALFMDGRFTDACLQFNFHGWKVVVEGETLTEIVHLFQIQQLATVKASLSESNHVQGRCRVDRIVVSKLKEDAGTMDPVC